ncbi:MAG: VIT1/CCC1 transporter family protein [Candidatus Neomarinimicrobiota bacterium]
MHGKAVVDKPIDDALKQRILKAQKIEITEYIIYGKLSRSEMVAHNRDVLDRISSDELRHYNFLKEHSREDVKPNRWMIVKYYLIARILGLTFGLKLMERGEERAQKNYEAMMEIMPSAEMLVREEIEHERELIDLIDEDRLRYVGSMVLGLNDALVELTGALAGFTLALQNTRLIAMVGMVTGIAASLSMAASEYLSTKTEEDARNPLNAAVYTGLAYIVTVIFLIFPYLVFSDYFFCLAFTIFNAILVILVFTFYVSVVREISFRNRFVEMATISLGVAFLTFWIGFLIRRILGVEL